MDLNGNTIFINPAAEKMLGYEQEELVGKPQHETIHHKNKNGAPYPKKDCPIYATFKDGKIHTISDEFFWRKDGSSFPVEYTSTPQIENGEVVGAVVVFRDITLQKQNQQKLQEYSTHLESMVKLRTRKLTNSLREIEESKNQINGILMSIGDGLVVTDNNNLVILLNPMAEKILGKSAKELLFNPLDEGIFKQLTSNGNSQSSQNHFDIVLSNSIDGEMSKTYNAVTNPISDKEGSTIGRVTIMFDVTREREVDRLKTEFLSTAAHELRTPLSSIQGFSELLMINHSLSEDQKKDLFKIINTESLNLSNIVDDLLDVSRIESGASFSLNKDFYDAKNLVNSIINFFSKQTELHSFVLFAPNDDFKIFIDKEKMEQALKNLYSNAIKYSPKGGKIETTIQVLENEVKFSIKDQGIGMSPVQVQKVFNKFYRANTGNSEIGGAGLGMTIVKFIIEKHKGRIWLESEPERGTTVNFTIPK